MKLHITEKERQELFEAVEEFDDAEWVRKYGTTGKYIKQCMEELDTEELRDLVKGYWSLLHSLLQKYDYARLDSTKPKAELMSYRGISGILVS